MMLEVINDPEFVTDFRLGVSTGTRQDDGQWNESRQWHELRGAVQPAAQSDKGKSTQYLTEGDRNQPSINIWCGHTLNPTFDGAAITGDLVEWHSENYQVVDALNWSQYGYWWAMAVRVVRHE